MDLLALLALALAVRLALLPGPGNTSDLLGLINAGSQVATHGPQALYGTPELTNFDHNYNYPPLFPYLLGATFRLWSLVAPTLGVVPAGGQTGTDGLATVPPYPVAAALVKSWAIAGDLAIGVVIHGWVRRRAGRHWAVAAAAAFLLAPGTLYNGAWWGQVDSLFSLCITAALVSLAAGHPTRAWLWLAAGILLKPQAVVGAPIVAAATMLHYGRHGLVRGTLAGGALAALITAPLWTTGHLEQLRSVYLRSVGAYPHVSVNAFNVWWAAGGRELGWSDDTYVLVAGLSHRQAGLLALLGFLGLAVWYLRPLERRAAHRQDAWRGEEPPWFLAAATLYVAFFVAPTQIHERYLFPALPLLALLLHRHRMLLLAFGLLSVTFAANLVHVVPWHPAAVAALEAAGLTPRRIAVANVLALGLLTSVVLRTHVRRQGVEPVTQEGRTPVGDLGWRRGARAARAALALGLALYNVTLQASLAAPWRMGPFRPVDPLLLALFAFAAASIAVGRRGRAAPGGRADVPPVASAVLSASSPRDVASAR